MAPFVFYESESRLRESMALLEEPFENEQSKKVGYSKTVDGYSFAIVPTKVTSGKARCSSLLKKLVIYTPWLKRIVEPKASSVLGPASHVNEPSACCTCT